MAYDALFQPMKIGTMEVKNRMVNELEWRLNVKADTSSFDS